jgi:hypothetical protein
MKFTCFSQLSIIDYLNWSEIQYVMEDYYRLKLNAFLVHQNPNREVRCSLNDAKEVHHYQHFGYYQSDLA